LILAKLLVVVMALDSLIKSIFGMLWDILCKLTLLARSTDSIGAASFDLCFLEGLRPRSLAIYKKALSDWKHWIGQDVAGIHYAWELDRSLLSYARSLNISKSKLQHLLSAIERVSPHCKGKLILATAHIKCLQEVHPTKHTTPMSWVGCLCVSWWLANHDFSRVGGLLIIQWAAALRPSEALNLRIEDITVSTLPSSLGAVILRLGVKSRTKVNRAQFVILRPDRAPIAVRVVKAFLASTPPGCRLTSLVTTSQYGRLLERAFCALKVPHLWTSHSPRAGWASDSVLRGLPFTDIREHGRWVSDASLRHYLDIVGTLTVHEQTAHLDGPAKFLEEKFLHRYPWWTS
jgi:integrase